MPDQAPDGGHGETAGPGTATSIAHRVLIAVGITAAVAVQLLVLWYARDVLLLAFAGVLLGIFLRRLATWVSGHTPLSPRWGLLGVVLAFLGALVGAFALRGPAIAAEVRNLREELPRAAESLQARLAEYDWGQRAIEAAPSPQELLPDEPDAISRVTGVASRTFSGLASFGIILFLGIVLAALLPLERPLRGGAEGAGIRHARVPRGRGCAHARP